VLAEWGSSSSSYGRWIKLAVVGYSSRDKYCEDKHPRGNLDKRSKINSAKQDLKDHTSRHQKMGQRSIIVDDVIFIDVRSKEDDYLNLNLNYYKTLLL
jgi:hypothetical protein